ncbi:MAG: S-layer homology domain-containing protein [Clostridia bacterium]|nr:S-layer homology domain-containing protein [Clostridia bacterium]
MIKKFISAICAASIALGSMGSLALAADEAQIKYNYKLSMESDSDFKMVYGYNGGTISTKKSYTAGKYGNALQITYPGHLISDGSKRYNGFVMQFKTDEFDVGNERMTMLDLMRDTSNFSMWVHTPKTVDHGNGAVANRIIELIFEFTTTGGSKKFAKKFQIPNTGEWAYITIPVTAFKSGSLNMADGLKDESITAAAQMSISFPYKDYFGANPDEATLNNPWEEPFIIDELLFDRSTDAVKAITPPSTGEEMYFENAEIEGVAVKGVPVQGFDKNASTNVIEVPSNYTAENIKKNVTVTVAAPTVEKTNVSQELTGASYEITAPDSVPGNGVITVISGSRKVRKNYNIRFEAKTGIMPDINGITNSGGSIKVPITNESASGSASVTALAVSKNADGVAVSTSLSEEQSIGAGQSIDLNFNLKTENKDSVEVYIFNNETDYKLLCAPITIGKGVMAYTEPAANLSSVDVVTDENDDSISVSGNAEGSVFVALKNEDGYINAQLIDTKNGTFSGTVNSGGKAYGRISVVLSCANTVIRELYNASPSEVASCISEYKALSTDPEECNDYFEKYKYVLNLDNSMTGKLAKDEISNAVSIADRSVNSINDIRHKIGEELCLAAINERDTAIIKDIYENYNDLAGFDANTSYFKKYITDSNQLNKVINYVAKNKYNSLENAQTSFKEGSILESLNSVKGYGELESLIGENEDILGDFLNYAKLRGLNSTDETGFYKYASQKGISSLDSLNTLLNEYISNGIKDNTSGTGIGSISGGGSVSGTTTVVNKPVVKPEATSKPSAFSDINNSHWAYSSVMGLKTLDIIDGRDDGSFGTDDAVTREEFVKMLLGTFGMEATAVEGPFGDVDKDAWYAPYVNTATSMGIVSGIENDVFGTGRRITRQDMSVLIGRFMEKQGCELNGEALTAFTDDESISNYAKRSVYGLKNFGLINGMDDGSFEPLSEATRAQTAKILYSVHSYMKSRNISVSDIEDNSLFGIMIRKLMALGIIDFPQGESEIVTRGQFAKYAAAFANAADYGYNDGKIIFSDVEIGNRYYNSVRYLADMGFIDTDKSSFDVDSPITLGDAAVIMCRILGYDRYAIERGGNISVYISTASKYDIIPSLGKGEDDSLNFSDVLSILESAAEANMMVTDFTGSKEIYKETETSALYYYHKILVLDDIIYAVGTRTIDGSSGLVDNNVRVGRYNFVSETRDAYRYLGYRVNAYYTENEDVLKFIEPSDKNDVLVIDGQLISSFDGNTLKYYKSEESLAERRETIPKTANRLYNYNFTADFSEEEMKNAEEVIFIDCNKDGNYDTVNLINEDIYCVTQISAYEMTIYDYYSQPAVKLEDMKSVTVYDAEGKLSTVGAVSTYDIVSVMKDKQNDNVILYISKDYIDGTVESTGYDNNNHRTVRIDGKNYTLTDTLEKQPTVASLVTVGNEVEILLDRHGRAAYIELYDGKDNSYAYIIKAVSEEVGVDPFLRMYTVSDGIRDIKLSSKAVINNTKIKENEDLDKLFKTANIDPDSVNQLVRYKLNDKGEISQVKTAQYIEGAEVYTTGSAFTRIADMEDIYYSATYRNFPGSVRVNSETQILCVPKSYSLMRDESYYGVKEFKDMKNDTFDKVEVYNVSKDMTAGVLVIRADNGGGKQITYSTPIAAVKKIYEISMNGEIGYSVDLLYNGSEQSFVFADGVKIEQLYKGKDGEPVSSVLGVGDIIRFATNSRDEITDYYKVFDFDNKDDSNIVIRGNEYENKNSYIGSSKTLIAFNGMAKNPSEDVISGRVWEGKNPYWFTGVQYSTEMGIVESISGTTMIIHIIPGTEGSNKTECDRYFNLTNKRIYVLETSGDGVHLGTVNDIIPANLAGEENASRVIISRHNDVPSICAVINR